MFVLKKFECRRDVNGGSPESDPAPDVGKDWLSAGGKNKSKGLSEGHVEVSCNLSVYTTEDNDSDMSQVTYQSVGHDGGFTCDLAASPRLLKPQGLPRFTFKSLLPSLQPGNRPSTPSSPRPGTSRPSTPRSAFSSPRSTFPGAGISDSSVGRTPVEKRYGSLPSNSGGCHLRNGASVNANVYGVLQQSFKVMRC